MTDTADDHKRGCEGRNYTCTCGYDDARDAEIERLRAQGNPTPSSSLGGWQTVNNIPRNRDVLIIGPNGMLVYRVSDDNWREEFEFSGDEPSHWMELPAAPTVEIDQ